MPPAPVERYHSLDALRAAMMLLGLVLHSAASYIRTPIGWAWPYQDPQTSIAFDLLIFFIHLFRMPVFFVAAGFFAALLYYRDGPARFARNRARRVLLPLALFWPLVIPLVGLGFAFSAQQIGGRSPFDMVTHPLMEQPLLGHLWFLYHLLFLYVAAALVVPITARVPHGLKERGAIAFRRVATHVWGAVVLGSLTALTLIPMEAPGLDTSATVIPALRVLVAYSVFFAFGWILYGQRDVLPSFATRWKWAAVGGVCVGVAYLLVLVARPENDSMLWHLTGVALAGLSTWLLIFGIVGLFIRYMEQPRPLVRYFSDASYWMYLVHLPAAAFFPGLLAHSSAPAFVKFVAVVTLTTSATVVTYHYLVRSTVVGELLNGRRYPRTLAPAAAARDGAAV